jgi:hypothetical protein
MGNPETKATLVYDTVQRQSNERQLKDEYGPHRKNGIDSGAGKCWRFRVLHQVVLNTLKI